MPEARSPEQIIAQAEALEALRKSDGWRLVEEYLVSKVDQALHALLSAPPDDVAAIAKAQAQSTACKGLAIWIDEQIRRGQEARKSLQRRERDAPRSR